MNNRNELINKLETISALWNKGTAIQNKINTYKPADNYKREISDLKNGNEIFYEKVN